MDRNKILEEIQKVFNYVFKDNSKIITESITANDIDGWDSFTNIELIAQVEKHFNIKISLQDVLNMESVSDLILIIIREISNE